MDIDNLLSKNFRCMLIIVSKYLCCFHFLCILWFVCVRAIAITIKAALNHMIWGPARSGPWRLQNDNCQKGASSRQRFLAISVRKVWNLFTDSESTTYWGQITLKIHNIENWSRKKCRMLCGLQPMPIKLLVVTNPAWNVKLVRVPWQQLLKTGMALSYHALMQQSEDRNITP